MVIIVGSVSQENFLRSAEAVYIRDELVRMEADPAYITPTTFTTLTVDNKLLFVDKHMGYLSRHTKLDPLQYLANLKLMTRRNLG